MSAVDADVIIAGAGLSGLSLAVALLDAGLPEDARIMLVDPRETLSGADRTWCFFDLVPHAFESAITHRWSRWRVRNGAAEVLRAAPGIAYCRIPGERFYELALERLVAAGGRVEFLLGVTVEHLDDRGAHVDVHTSAGVLRTRLAMDSRPPPLTRVADDGKDVNLLQHFRGRVVRSAEPVFEVDTATLMDFDVSQAEGIHFVYVLPFDAHTALVESTFFTDRLLPDAVYEARAATSRRGVPDQFARERGDPADDGALRRVAEPADRTHRHGGRACETVQRICLSSRAAFCPRVRTAGGFCAACRWLRRATRCAERSHDSARHHFPVVSAQPS